MCLRIRAYAAKCEPADMLYRLHVAPNRYSQNTRCIFFYRMLTCIQVMIVLSVSGVVRADICALERKFKSV